MLGKIDNQRKLAEMYSLADLILLTSKKETFSMVTAESLCCGTPVVGFKAGAPEAIAMKEYTSFVEYGKLGALKKAVETTLSKKWDQKEISEKAAMQYGKETMCDKYIEVYRELYEQRDDRE